MNEAVHEAGQAKSLLADAARAGVVGFDDSALVLAATTVEEIGRLVDALRVQLAGEIDERSRYELGRDGLVPRPSRHPVLRGRIDRHRQRGAVVPGAPPCPARLRV